MTQPPSTQDTPQNQPPQNLPPVTPTQQHAQPSQQQQGSSGRGPGQEILDALNALPERITNSIKEAITPPRAPVANQQQQGQQSQGNNAQNATAANSQQQNNSHQNSAGTDKGKDEGKGTPGKKSFAEWWFNG
jgi:hypothetical protein